MITVAFIGGRIHTTPAATRGTLVWIESSAGTVLASFIIQPAQYLALIDVMSQLVKQNNAKIMKELCK